MLPIMVSPNLVSLLPFVSRLTNNLSYLEFSEATRQRLAAIAADLVDTAPASIHCARIHACLVPSVLEIFFLSF
jgi:hypothetical protein